MNVQYLSPSVWTIDNFLSIKECEQLIEFSEHRGYESAKVSLPEGAQLLTGIRNNERILYEDADLAQTYWQRLKPFCPASIDNWEAIGLNEQWRFYKYSPKERFKRHIDGRFRRNDREGKPDYVLNLPKRGF